MQNIDFNLNPEQLVAIVSTEENINNLSDWCIKSGIDSSIVHTYDGYLNYLSNKKL